MSDDSEKYDNEACRRVMTFLFGSEAKAMAYGEALLRYTTPAEDESNARRHDIGDELARQTARELEPPGFEPKSEVACAPEPTLTREEEAEFDAYMERVYARAGIEKP